MKTVAGWCRRKCASDRSHAPSHSRVFGSSYRWNSNPTPRTAVPPRRGTTLGKPYEIGSVFSSAVSRRVSHHARAPHHWCQTVTVTADRRCSFGRRGYKQ